MALRYPRLVQPGFHLPDNSGLFFLYGRSDFGVVVRPLRVTDSGLELQPPLTLEGALPSRVLAHMTLTDSGPRVRLAWDRAAQDQHQICLGAVGGTGWAEDPRVVYGAPRSLLCMELQPVTFGQTGWIQALFGAEDGAAALRYVRVSLDHPLDPLESISLDPPEPSPEAWAVSSAEVGGLVVAVRCGGELRCVDARDQDQSWRVLHDGSVGTFGLHLLASRFTRCTWWWPPRRARSPSHRWWVSRAC